MEPIQNIRNHSDVYIYWPDLKILTITTPEAIWMVYNFIGARKEIGQPLATVCMPCSLLTYEEAVWSHMREEIEVLQVDNDSESLQYPGGL